MNENEPPLTPPNLPAEDVDATLPPPPPKKKPRRLWLKIVAGLVVFLILLVLLLPTIAGTGIVRSIVVGKVNDQINGKLDIADWSFGWTSGARIDGVKLVDGDGRQLLQLAHLDAPVSLIGLMRGKYDLGKVVVDGLDFDLRRDADGKLNFSELAKPSEKKPAEPSAPTPSTPSTPPAPSSPAPARSEPEPTKLPNFSGEFVLTNCRGTIDDAETKNSFHLTSLEADVKIPDINQPIEETVDAAVDNGAGQSGKLSVKGTTLVVKNNVLLTDPAQILREASVDQNITLSGFDLASMTPLLGPGSGIDQLAGLTDGTFGLHIAPDSAAALNALLRVTKLSVGGKALKGDTLAAQSLELSAQHISFALEKDAAGMDAARIVTGPADGSSPVAINLVQADGAKSTVTLFANATSGSLARLAKNLSPGDTGTIQAAANIEFGHLATSMPHLFDLQPGVQLSSGNLTETLKVDLTADKSTVNEVLHVTNIAGRNSNTKSDIALQPIDLTAQTDNLGGGGMLPDLRDLKLNLTSAFATATANAATIDDLTGEVHATLQSAQHELSQIFDFGDKKLEGNLDVSINSKGNLFKAAPTADALKSLHVVIENDRTASFDVHGTLKDLRLSGISAKPVDEPLIQFASKGQLQGAATDTIDKLSNFDFNSQVGDLQHPTLDADITADMTLHSGAGAVHSVSIKKCNIDLPLAQQQLGGLIPALDQVHTSAGTLVVGGFVNGHGPSTRMLLQVILGNVDMQRIGTDASVAPVSLLSGYSLTAAADATLTSDSSGSSFSLNKLSVTDNQNLVSVQKTDAKLKLTTGSGADAKNVGVVDMIQQAEASISLPGLDKLSALLDALSPPKPDAHGAAKPQAVVTAGNATFTLTASHKDNQLVIVPQFKISPDFAVKAGSVSQTVGPVDFGANIALASAADSQQIGEVDISQLAAHGAGTELSLKEPLKISDLSELSRLMPGAKPGDAASGSAPALAAGLLIKGDIAPIARLLETLDGAVAGSEYPYTGAFNLDQNVSAADGNIALQGKGDVTNFVLHKGDAVQFAESDIHLGDDVALQSGGTNLNITGVTLAMTSTNALNLALKGNVLGLSDRRELQDMTADLTYDAAPLWKIILPLTSPKTQDQFKDAVVAGKFTKHFVVAGSYPAAVAFNDAVKNLSASGGIALTTFNGAGINLSNLDVPVFMKNGKVYVANSDKPGDIAAPASMNGGKLALGGIMLDLGDPHMLLDIPPNSHLLQNVALNSLLANLLGNDVGNPLFAGASSSTGLMSVTVDKCQAVPLDDTLKKNVASNVGQLNMNVAIQDLTIGGGLLGSASSKIAPLLKIVQGFLKSGAAADFSGIKGSVKDYKITLAKGVTTHDMTIVLGEGKRSMHLTSTVLLETMMLKDTVLTLPVSLWGIPDSKWPNGINLALNGPVASPKFDAATAVKKSVGSNPLDLLGGGKNDNGGGGNDLQNTLNGLFGKNKTKDQN